MIFGSTLLEVAIGVIFVYLLMSMLCSALSELIEAFLKYRAKDLKKGIKMLLDDPDLANDFFAHPLIKPLGKKPSYIPARTFSLALWNLATTKAAQAQNVAAGVTRDLDAIRSLIGGLKDPKYKDIQTSLLTLIDEAGNDINIARANIENWYDDAMDRVSGWYKRRVHFILIFIGLVAATALNVDTINITKALLYNDTLRASVAAAADNYIKENPASTPTPATTPATPPATEGGATPASTQPSQTAEEEIDLARKKINDIRGELNKLGLPISWATAPDANDDKYKDKEGEKAGQGRKRYEKDLEAYKVDPRRVPDTPNGVFLKILGILLTALAVSQGAPFWFDLLNKFVVIRSTIKPHEKSPDQPSKDKPAPETTKEQKEPEKKEGENKG